MLSHGRRPSFRPAIILVAIFATVVLPRSTARGAKPREPGPVQVTLENGLQVLIVGRINTPLVHMGLFYGAGSASEPDSLAGLAHLVEHLMFTSSQNYPAGGLRRGLALHAAYANASTWQYGMVMRSDGLPQFLPEILALEADRMARLSPGPGDLAREKQVVRQELALRKRLSALEDLNAAVFQAGYPQHPFARPVIGTEESLRRISLADVTAFTRARMHPGNAVLVLVGPADPDTMLVQVEQILGILVADGSEPEFRIGRASSPAGREPSGVEDALPEPSHGRVVLDRYDVEGFTVSLGFRLPLHSEADRARARFLASLLEVQEARTRMRTLPGEAFLTISSSFAYRPQTRADPDGSASDVDAQAGLASLWQAIDMAALRLLDPAIYAEMRERTLTRLARSARRPESLVWTLGLDALNGYLPLGHEQLRAHLLAMDREEFQTYLRRELDASRVIVGILHGRDSGRQATVALPEKRGSGDIANDLDPLDHLTESEIRPVLEVYAHAAVAQIVNVALPNGLPLHILPIPDSERLQLGGVRNFPCLQDERRGKKQGIGIIYNHLVNHGFESPPQTYLAESPPFRAPFAAHFQVSPFELHYRAQGAGDQVNEISASLKARLQSDDFNLARWQRLLVGGSATFARMQRQPTNQARLYRWSRLFGEDHPVLGRWRGDPRTIEKIKYQDIQKFHRQVVANGHTHLLAVGEVDINELEGILAVDFGGREGFALQRSESPPQLLAGREGMVFPAFDKQDARLTLSFPPLVLAADPEADWSEVKLLVEVLRMRLRARLRLEVGLVYTVAVAVQEGPGCLVPEVYTSCLPARAPDVLESIQAVLQELATTGVDTDTLLRAQLLVAGQLLGQLADPARGYELLQEMVFCGEVSENPLASLLAVTEPELTRLLRRVVSADRFVFSVTGPLFAEDIALFDLP